MTIEKKVIYVTPGVEGTNSLVKAVSMRALEEGVDSIVVASMKGKAALKIAEEVKNTVKVVSVTEFSYGENVKKAMKKLKIIAVENADLPIQDRKEMREALEIFGSGVKAALEVASISAEKGLVKDKTIAVAGGKGGLDTAILLRPAAPNDFNNPDPEKRMSVLEILALPSHY